MKFYFSLKNAIEYLRRDWKHHLYIWCAIALIYFIDLITAWGTTDRNPFWSVCGIYYGNLPDGFVLWAITLITSFIAVYFFTLKQLELSLLNFFSVDGIGFEKMKISIIEKMLHLVYKIIFYSFTASFFGFIISFIIYQRDYSILTFISHLFEKNHVAENLNSDFNKTNFLLMNTRFWREEQSGFYFIHILATIIRNFPLAFLTCFIFVFYETIKVIAPLRILSLKIKEENREKDLQIEMFNLHMSILNQEDWFHFASNIFTESRKSLLAMVRNHVNPESVAHNNVINRLNIFLKELSELFRYRSANSLENHIALKKEIDAIKSLEKILHYKDPTFKFDISEMEDDQPDDIKIIPGVIYEYVWNAYKHSQGAKNRAAKIALSVNKNNILTFRCVNTKSNDNNVNNLLAAISGKGLEITAKRLNFHYPERHNINIKDKKEENLFEINLMIDLN